MSSSGLPRTRDTQTYWSQSSKGATKAIKGLGHLMSGEAERAGTVLPQEEKAQRN